MRKILAVAILIIFAQTVRAQGEYDVYLLIGQSNAVGFAPLEPGDEKVVDGVFLLDSLGKAVPCSGVANRFSSLPDLGKRMGYNLGVSFGKMMHEVTGRKILLVVNAKGGTTISKWLPTAEDPLFYNEAVRRTRQAQAYGTVKGILWHQGEGDARWPGQYAKRAKLLFETLRKDLNDPEIPVVVGEAGHWFVSKDGTVTSEGINEVLRGLPYSISNLLCVTAEGCTPIYDNIHFDHKSLELLGRRYASKILSFGQGMFIEVENACTDIFVAKQGWYHVYARACNCNPPKTSGSGPVGFRIKLNQQVLSGNLGCGGGSWKWDYAGKVYLKSGSSTLSLIGLSGFDGRCDAVWITSNKESLPPAGGDELIEFRRNIGVMKTPNTYESK